MCLTKDDTKQKELQELRQYARMKLAELESAENTEIEPDMSEFERAVEKLEHGTKEEKESAERVVMHYLPAIYESIQLIAKKSNTSLL